MARLSGKVAMITGATGGIGAATAAAFLREGAQVMLVGRSAEKLEETCGRLTDNGAVASFVTIAEDETGVRESVAATVDTFGGIDVLFANAGTEGNVKPLTDLDVDDFESVLRTNVVGVWLAIKSCVTPMTERGGGSIIATSSIAGKIGFPGLAHYVASKHAVNGLVKSAALELAAAGIRVNGIAPGMIDNRMLNSIADQLAPDGPEELMGSLIPLIPQQRLGRSEEVAEFAVFLASDESSYCTGSTHLMDGGFVAA